MSFKVFVPPPPSTPTVPKQKASSPWAPAGLRPAGQFGLNPLSKILPPPPPPGSQQAGCILVSFIVAGRELVHAASEQPRIWARETESCPEPAPNID